MEKIEFIILSLWCFALLLALLNIGYHAYLKITHTSMRFLETIQFMFGMFALRIRYSFSKKKVTPSAWNTQQSLETLTLSELDNPVPPVRPTSRSKSSNRPKEPSKRGVRKERSVRN
jgi:hypothetical protein